MLPTHCLCLTALPPLPSLPTGPSRPEAQCVPYYVSQCASGRWDERVTATALIPADPVPPRRSLSALAVTLALDCTQPRAYYSNCLLGSARSFLNPPTHPKPPYTSHTEGKSDNLERSIMFTNWKRNRIYIASWRRKRDQTEMTSTNWKDSNLLGRENKIVMDGGTYPPAHFRASLPVPSSTPALAAAS